MNGNVGVGTWVPYYALDVKGTLKAAAFVGDGSAITTNQGWTVNGAKVYTSSDAYNVGLGTSTPGGKFVVMNGNVGVGTWLPTTPLDFNGFSTDNIASDPTYRGLIDFHYNFAGADRGLSTNNGIEFKASSSGAGWGFRILNYDNLGGNTPLVIQSRANSVSWTDVLRINQIGAQAAAIGIGTTYPQSRLNVVGGVAIGAGVNSNFVTTSAPVGGLIVEGNTGIGTVLPQAQLAVLGGNVGIGTWTGNQGALVVAGGNVGIFTIAPSQLLDIANSSLAGQQSNMTIKSTGAGAFYRMDRATTSQTAAMYLGTAGSQQWLVGLYPQSTDDFYIGTAISALPYLSILQSNGNVGIGTLAAASKFSVAGGVGIGTGISSNYVNLVPAPSGGLTVEGNVGIGTKTPQAQLSVAGSMGIGTWTATGGALEIFNGYMGIGTSAPGTALGVVGNVGLGSTALATAALQVNSNPNSTDGLTVLSWGGTSHYIKFSPSSSPGAFNNLVSVGNEEIIFSNTAMDSGNLIIAPWSTSQSYRGVRMDGSSGNVTVGTWSSPNKLAVAGSIGIGTGLNSGYLSTSAPLGGMIIENNVGIGTKTPQTLFSVVASNVGIGTWTASGGNLIVNAGNVGIGTVFPGTALDVVGTIRATAFVGDGLAVTAPGGWILSGTNVYTTGMNVGIGSAAPQGGVIIANGNVGIGSNIATDRLTITGNGVSSLFTVNHSGPSDPAPFLITSTGNVGIGTTSFSGTLGASGVFQVYNYSTNPSADKAKIIAQFTKISDATSTENPGVWLACSGANCGLSNPSTNIGIIRITGFNYGTSNMIDSEDNFVVQANGNIGIGTLLPTSNLTVNGGVNIGNSGTFVTTQAPDGGLTVQANTGIGTFKPQSALAVLGNVGIGTWTADGGNLIVRGDNVGINTVTPFGKLVVMGNVGIGTNVPANAHLKVLSSTNDVLDGTLLAQGPNVITFDIGNTSNRVWAFGSLTDGSLWLREDSNGGGSSSGRTPFRTSTVNRDAVGMGTTTSPDAFEISGSFNASNAGVGVSGGMGIGTNDSSSYIYSSAPNGGIIAEGNVGLGTAVPQAQLVLNGNVGIGTWSADGGALVISAGSNVGINTSMPSFDLNVAGNVGIGTAVGNQNYTRINNLAVTAREYDNGNSGAAATINWNNGNKQKITLTNSSVTLSFTAPSPGVADLLLKIVQDSSGNEGTTFTWPGTVKWSGGAPTLTTAASAVDIVTCSYDGSNYYCTPWFNFH